MWSTYHKWNYLGQRISIYLLNSLPISLSFQSNPSLLKYRSLLNYICKTRELNIKGDASLSKSPPIGGLFTCHKNPSAPSSLSLPLHVLRHLLCFSLKARGVLGVAVWNDNIKNRDELVRIIIDNSVLFQTKKGRKEKNLVNQLEKLSRNLCYRIHNKRIMKLSEE